MVLLSIILGMVVACGIDHSRGELAGIKSIQQVFSVVTYNVQSRPILDDARSRINLPIIGSRLSAYDIVQTQECFSNCDLLINAASQPFKTYFDQRIHWWSLANSGLVGMTHHPLQGVVTKFYQARGEIPDAVASKGLILMKIKIGSADVDFYSTHMQAGSSAWAHSARFKQVEELITFVNEYSPPHRHVIVSGDFNMGPSRPDKAWDQYTPNHYSSQLDMQQRTAAFDHLRSSLALEDASDLINGPNLDYIERILFRPAHDQKLVPLSWQDVSPDFTDARGQGLSDGSPIVVRFGL